MAKFYQHMQPGEQLGNITKLRYIDDISDDELIIYVFEDQSKCAEEYISEINNAEAFNGRYVMAELTDPLNKWQFRVKEFNLNETQTVVAADGKTYEVPSPGIDRNGDHMSVSFTADGDPIARKVSSAGKRTDSIPPRIIKNKKVEPKENYLLSLHPELLDGNYTSANPSDIFSHTVLNKKPTNNVQEEQPLQKKLEAENIINNHQTTVINKNISSPISTNVIETVKTASITIDIDNILAAAEYDKVVIKKDGNIEELTIEDFSKRLTCATEPVSVQNSTVSVFDSDTYEEDILISNMIDKSKKKVYTIGVDVDIELPPKEVYKTIKDVYPEGMSDHFVTCIARRMNSTTLKEALASGLTAYYEIDE